MDNLNLIHERYKSRQLIITGDLNARVGNITCYDPMITHHPNPDNTVNASGSKLLKWLQQHKDMIVVNGASCLGKRVQLCYKFHIL